MKHSEMINNTTSAKQLALSVGVGLFLRFSFFSKVCFEMRSQVLLNNNTM